MNIKYMKVIGGLGLIGRSLSALPKFWWEYRTRSRQSRSPDRSSARGWRETRSCLAKTSTARSALECGVLDELVPTEELMDFAMAKALQVSRLPQIGFGKVKRQFRASNLAMIEAAIAGNEPLLNGWLSKETIEAAAFVLKGGK